MSSHAGNGGAPGLGVVYFGNDWHAENRTSSHHIASRLARRMPLLYVDSPGMRAPGGSARDLRRAVRKLLSALRAPRLVEPNLWLCTVPQLPLRRVPGVDACNRLFGRWAVRRALRRTRMGPRMSWFVVPHPGFLAGQLDELLCVYYCIDDYAAHPGVDADTIARRDHALSLAADLQFVAPPALLPHKRRLNAATHFAPHGVDAELFAQASAAGTPVPRAARALPGPVVGYFGSIHEWIDLELIGWLARCRPRWSFLLVGHAAVDVQALRALPNVHLPGPRPYGELPQWAKAFDVAIIPYRDNRQVANCNPLKLREYLATGKPVVSVRQPEIEKFARWVHLADDHQGFLAALDRVLAAPEPPGATTARMAAVADQTWDRRVEEILSVVHEALAARPRATPVPALDLP